ncbi:MAG: glycosyl hydrolase [Fibrobacter sp.]|nr:glycosyl hydrolase [Fibrobacter sp.]
MKHLKRCLKTAGAVALCLAAASSESFAQTNVIVDPGKRYQLFEGWGSSLCWWAVKAGAWNEANRSKLIGAIVDPDTGLGYNVFRYNIGGGDQPGHNHLTKGDGGAAVPGYRPKEGGAYDWNADPYQRNIAFEIAKRAKDPIFEAFSNSPPWWMTKSGCVAGGTNGADNLKEDYFDDFADYLSEVALHFKDYWGITFRTVEPFNEPSAGWWKVNGTQEGCGFKNKQSEMIVELGKALTRKGLFPETSVSAADESNIGDALKRFNGYSTEALSYMFQVNTHSYSGYDSRGALYEAAFAKNKRIWQSESGPLHKGKNTENIALWMAGVIMADLRDMKASAWVDWQLGDPSANWQTFALDHKNQTFTRGVRYYMHAAFSRALRPGSRIIDSDNANTLAAIRPDGSLVLIVRNSGSSDVKYNFDLRSFNSIGSVAKVHVFALPGSLKAGSDIALSGRALAMTAKANTITTLVIADAEGGTCTSTAVVPYVKIHDGGWNETTEILLNKGDSLRIGPHPHREGRWTWSGPNGFNQVGREIVFKDVDGTYSGVYHATYVNASGCETEVDFEIIVNDPDNPYVLPDTSTVDTSVVDTSAVDTSAVDTSAVDTSAVDTATVDTTVTDTSSAIKTLRHTPQLRINESVQVFDMQGRLLGSLQARTLNNGNLAATLRARFSYRGVYLVRQGTWMRRVHVD